MTGEEFVVYNVTGEYGDEPQPFLRLCGERTILEEAGELVNGDRQESYGHPALDLACTAGLWSAWLSRRLGITVSLTGEDVALCMSLLKHARLAAETPTRDSLVDAAGYLACVEMIQRAGSVDGPSR